MFTPHQLSHDEQETLDYLLFSSQGQILIQELAYLRYRDISNNLIQVHERTIVLTDKMWEIINYHSNQPQQSDKYIFPILNEDDTYEQHDIAIRLIEQKINNLMNNTF